MLARCRQGIERKPRVLRAAFTLVEVLMSVVILTMVFAGVIYGYVQANRCAEWSSMSLAAQSLASQGMEQARAAQWNSQIWPLPTNSCDTDQLWVTNTVGATWTTNLTGSNYAMDIPSTGAPFYATNVITITTLQITPPLRMIRSDCIWKFPSTGKIFTNTDVTYRAPDA
jgi:type II secretory pathway pseudopilin PulG